MGVQLPKNVKKWHFFNFFVNIFIKIFIFQVFLPKLIEFDVPDGLKRRASKFCTNSTKNHIFRPPGCRDWAQTLSRSKIIFFRPRWGTSFLIAAFLIADGGGVREKSEILVKHRFFQWFLMVLRLEIIEKWQGKSFPPRYDPPAPKKRPKIAFFRQQFHFFKTFAKDHQK